METMKFEDMNLSSGTLKAVLEMGFEEATPIQSQAIPVIMSGHDCLGQSQTGHNTLPNKRTDNTSQRRIQKTSKIQKQHNGSSNIWGTAY